jgi:hypothetical protein
VAWMQAPLRIRAKTVDLRGRPHEVRRRMLYTFAGLPYDICDIREENQLRARMHLAHDRTTRTSTAWELWVPKEARRKSFDRPVRKHRMILWA